MNWVAPAASYNEAGFRKFKTTALLEASGAANFFVFQDVHPASICMPAFVVNMGQSSFFHYPASQHEKSGVLIFADGHAETRKWRDPRTLQSEGLFNLPHDTASPGNPDLVWLQERTTIPE